MKPLHIISIIVVIIIIGIILTSVFNIETYSNFKEAQENINKEYSIMGVPIISNNFDSIKNEFPFNFLMVDDNKDTMQIIYEGAIPRDFEKLEQILVKGKINNNTFVARDIILKCPSKYSKTIE